MSLVPPGNVLLEHETDVEERVERKGKICGWYEAMMLQLVQEYALNVMSTCIVRCN